MKIPSKYKKVRNACFLTCFATGAVCNMSPLLFLTFRNMYGISYSKLGLLVLINFGTQLIFDIAFSLFSSKLPQKLSLKIMPVVMTIGFILFGFAPELFPNNIYIGLAIGTIIFSIGGGLSEVLTSPAISAIPCDNTEGLLSQHHSCYAWGVVYSVVVTTVFLNVSKASNWQYLSWIFAITPFLASLSFIGAEIPDMETGEQKQSSSGLFKNKVMWLSVVCIFMGGATECTMSQWCSSFAEQALGLDKTLGDVFGVALFGLTLGIGRTLYSHFGKNIMKILKLGAVGAALCYIVAVFSPLPIAGLIACALTGFCSSMLWPGSLMASSDRIPEGGVTMFALMAAGGDLGASLCPQFVGVVADMVVDGKLFSFMNTYSPEQLAIRIGLGIAVIFPLIALVCFNKLGKVEVAKKSEEIS